MFVKLGFSATTSTQGSSIPPLKPSVNSFRPAGALSAKRQCSAIITGLGIFLSSALLGLVGCRA